MRLTDEFKCAYRESHPDDQVTDLELYEVALPEIDLDLLNGWQQLQVGTPFCHLHETRQRKITLFDHFTDQFLDADKIVIANPLWNLQVPTRLKAWIDTICVTGKTFLYGESGEPIGLTTDKRVLHIQTAGGIFGGQDPASVYLKALFGFIGISDFQQIHAEGMDHNPDAAESIIDASVAAVRAAAASF